MGIIKGFFGWFAFMLFLTTLDTMVSDDIVALGTAIIIAGAVAHSSKE